LPQILSYMPILAFAFWFGQKLHHKVSEQQFRVLIYCLLLLAAIAMLLS
jgi:uncharacterized membrane protein YfcA